MIIYEEGRIVALSKNLLNILNSDLKEISEIITQIELETAVLHKETIKIKNISFKINKENLITLKNLDIFKLEKEEVLSAIPSEEEKKEEERLPNILQHTEPQEEQKEEESHPLQGLTTLQMPAEEEKKEEETVPDILQHTEPQEEQKEEESHPLQGLGTLQMPTEEEKKEEETLPNILQHTEPQEEQKEEESHPLQGLGTLQMPAEEEKKEEETLPNILQHTEPQEEQKEEESHPIQGLSTLQMPTEEEKKEEETLPNILQHTEPQEEQKEEESHPLQGLGTLQMPAEEEKKEEETLPNILQHTEPKEEQKEESHPLQGLSTLQMPAEEEKKEEETLPDILQKEEEPQVLELDFEENISECEKILAKKDIKGLIDKELETAIEELGIDEEMARELFADLLEQIKEKKDAFYHAVANKDYNELHEIAHYLKGASLNLRLSNISFIFKTIDEESKKETHIDSIKKLIDDFYKFLDKLENGDGNNDDTTTEENEASQPEIDPKIKAIVLNTIKQYLETQDEQRFQKDKGFIEKLLNRKIDSLKDLEYLWKDRK